MGPAGELRYPSYQMDKWSFCGIGEFQSYSPYALSQIQAAAKSAGHPEWGYSGGPSNAGSYNSYPSQTAFFSSSGFDNYRSDYGKFYLRWYSDALLTHAQDILTATNTVFGGALKVAVKVCPLSLSLSLSPALSPPSGGWHPLVVPRCLSCRRAHNRLLEHPWRPRHLRRHRKPPRQEQRHLRLHLP
jgi:hypothetical protein